MKFFKGEAKMYGSRGMNHYQIEKDDNNKFVFILRGTFTYSELRAMVDAAQLENFEFEFPKEAE